MGTARWETRDSRSQVAWAHLGTQRGDQQSRHISLHVDKGLASNNIPRHWLLPLPDLARRRVRHAHVQVWGCHVQSTSPTHMEAIKTMYEYADRQRILCVPNVGAAAGGQRARQQHASITALLMTGGYFLTPPPVAATLSLCCAQSRSCLEQNDSPRSSGRSFLASTPVLARSLPRAGLAQPRGGVSTVYPRPDMVLSASDCSEMGLGVWCAREIASPPVAWCCPRNVPSTRMPARTNGVGELMASTPLRGDNKPGHALFLRRFTCTP
ncbi:hypothetical protein J3F83DRAFT_495400 [Trichoderma novae-zelandiae]